MNFTAFEKQILSESFPNLLDLTEHNQIAIFDEGKQIKINLLKNNRDIISVVTSVYSDEHVTKYYPISTSNYQARDIRAIAELIELRLTRGT